jgi:S-adenosyl-L-methionine hydrolase (adenosine-forming)
MAKPLIALLSDFGTSDPYVGIMKGVMMDRCPKARFIDIMHDVYPQNVRHAGYLLRSAYRYFPTHTVFLVVVDPGVGTARRPLAIRTDHGMYVGPDNGVFSGVLEEADTWQAVSLALNADNNALSATFHGRDLFAPAAAALANGAPLNTLGSPVTDVIHIPLLHSAQPSPDVIAGDVIHIDHYGNVITSIGKFSWLDRANPSILALDWKPPLHIQSASAQITLCGQTINGIQYTYANGDAGALMTVINSDQQLEIAVNLGSAAKQLGVRVGDLVQLKFTSAD